MIKLENVSKSIYINGKKELILNNINLQINEADYIAILGKSGSGKSTLLNIIGFLDQNFLGTYLYYGKNANLFSDDEKSNFRNEHIGFIFQNFALIEHMTVEQNIMLPLLYTLKLQKSLENKLKDIMSFLGIYDIKNRNVRFLSGGQRQKVAIARALVNNPKFIIADEPTGSLDSKASAEIMNILYELNKKNVTIIMVTHDESNIKHCNKIIRISDGKIST